MRCVGHIREHVQAIFRAIVRGISRNAGCGAIYTAIYGAICRVYRGMPDAGLFLHPNLDFSLTFQVQFGLEIDPNNVDIGVLKLHRRRCVAPTPVAGEIQ